MILPVFLIIVGLGLLTVGADALVRGSSALALRLGIPPFVVGLTVVGFGTSSPELAASLAAALRGTGDLAVGNVVGSNIFNVAVILGLTALVAPIPIRFQAVRAELVWAVAAGAIPWIAFATNGVIPRWIGLLIFAGLIAFLVRAWIVGRNAPDNPEPKLEAELINLIPPASDMAVPAAAGTTEATARDVVDAGLPGEGSSSQFPSESPTTTTTAPSPPRYRFLTSVWWAVTLSVVGLGLLVAGSQLLVGGAVSIARSLGVSELIIGLTIVAAGTSLPELVTSVAAAMRKSADLALGNILGSNVFNIFGILGLTSIVVPQAVTRQPLALDVPVMFGLSILLAIICFTGAKISRLEAAGLLLIFVLYTIVLIGFAPAWFG
ncbi:MAG: calcium/sodium antiporter [Planctomycetota bacterium]